MSYLIVFYLSFSLFPRKWYRVGEYNIQVGARAKSHDENSIILKGKRDRMVKEKSAKKI